MMQVFYESGLTRQEVWPGEPLVVLPALAELVLEGKEAPKALLFNGVPQSADRKRFPCSPSGELTLVWESTQQVYTVRPLVRPWTPRDSGLYRRFLEDWDHSQQEGELDRILLGGVSLYAEDAWVEVRDNSPLLEELEQALPTLRRICNHPRTHLKVVSEVRPVETVKRLDWQAIPYLTAHSEDWKCRRAGSLRPARLLAQTEQEQLDLYENRVVCTLIDQILYQLRLQETWLEAQYDQLSGIMSSAVQTGSFGFDSIFQRAVSELLAAGRGTDEKRSAALALVNRLRQRCGSLHRRYQALRSSVLYRSLRGTKAVEAPLYETNLLTMDPLYSKVRQLWNTFRRAKRETRDCRETAGLDFAALYTQQLRFCQALWGFTAHVLRFEPVEEGLWRRQADQLELAILQEQGLLRITLRETAPRSLVLPPETPLPLEAGESFGPFSFDGIRLFWDPEVGETDIQQLCSRLQSKESRGKAQADEKQRYRTLKALLEEAVRKSPPPQCREVLLWPALADLDRSTRKAFIEAFCQAVQNQKTPVIAAFPQCEETVQTVTHYGLGPEDRVRLLPLSLYDINSYRRLQKLLLRAIVSLGMDRCPTCGGAMRRQGDHLICDACCGLQLTATACPHCGRAYRYLHYPVSEETLRDMEAVPPEQFFRWDSLYQYRDVIPLRTEGGRLRTVCPFCGS